jgi:hypothetical protein
MTVHYFFSRPWVEDWVAAGTCILPYELLPSRGCYSQLDEIS